MERVNEHPQHCGYNISLSSAVHELATGLQIIVMENYFSYLSTKTYVVGAQKNLLNETVLLSTQNTC